MKLPLTTIGCCVILMSLSAQHSCARAQQADPAFLQRALTALQAQRNAAADQAAAEKARADGLQEERDKAQARIKELEAAKESAAPEK